VTLADWPAQERPRERLIALGARALSNTELLAICLRSGCRGKSALQLAGELLSRKQSLTGLFDCEWQDFSSQPGLGMDKYAVLQASMELCRRQMLETLQQQEVLSSSSSTRNYLRAYYRSYKHEVFSCMFLNNQHHIVKVEELFRGTIDGAVVYPREVVKRCLFHNAAAVIFAHNHPSGAAQPSQADIAITRKLQQALNTVEVRVLDHFVVGNPEVVSFAERGLL